MRKTLTWIARGAALLALVAGLCVPAIGFAGPMLDDDDDGRNNRDVEREIDRSAREDREVSGQVLEINTLKDPPELEVATVDGVMKVRLLTKDLADKSGLRLGDHVTLVGEKISEVAFDCQELRIEGRLGDPINKDKDD